MPGWLDCLPRDQRRSYLSRLASSHRCGRSAARWCRRAAAHCGPPRIHAPTRLPFTCLSQPPYQLAYPGTPLAGGAGGNGRDTAVDVGFGGVPATYADPHCRAAPPGGRPAPACSLILDRRYPGMKRIPVVLGIGPLSASPDPASPPKAGSIPSVMRSGGLGIRGCAGRACPLPGRRGAGDEVTLLGDAERPARGELVLRPRCLVVAGHVQ